MIVVTAPTGSIGKQLLKLLLNSGEPCRVIARDPSKLGNLPGQVEVIQGSHSESAVVNKAFKGADAVFWLVPPPSREESMEAAYVGFACPAAEAIRTQGVKRVVAISALGRGTPLAAHAGLVTASLAMDDLIANTGVHFRALTMPSFMDNLLQQAVAIKAQGMFFSPLSGDRKFPTVATRDIATAAAQQLLDASWTGQCEIPVLGPEDLTLKELASIITEVVGKQVGFKQIPLETFKERLTGFGMSAAVVEGYAEMMAAKNEGLDNAVIRTPQATTPTTFREWCEASLKPVVLG